MPLTSAGSRALKNMKREYGAKKGTQVFYATMNKYGKKWHKSPDSYEDAGDSGAPRRLHYSSSPENVHKDEHPQKAGGARGNIQQADGTDNKRANYRTKSARVPEPPAGSTRFGDVNSYDDTKDF